MVCVLASSRASHVTPNIVTFCGAGERIHLYVVPATNLHLL